MQSMQRAARWVAALFLLLANSAALAAPADAGATPPRLSLIDGPVSFWRPGAADWSVASLNTPLAPGDALYAGENANLELQIGSRAFVRAGERTQISLVGRDRGHLQFRLADGQASFDLRALPPGLTVELDTPNAAFTIARAGYYRVSADQDTTLFITRRGGRATVIPAGGQALSVAPSEEVVVEGTDAPSVASYVAPELDAWDRWNYARTDHLVDSVSARYLASDVYGGDALDRHGDWRVVPDYGTVWMPSGLPSGWAPYSRGHWIWDPFYGWTWIDDAPWGWAPFHYGRWVFLAGFWAWVPGPVPQQSAYSPALVAFFSSGRGGISGAFGIGTPELSWVALSWGEPVIPWWGRRGFVGVPWWGGWGGPRVVNNVVIARNSEIDVRTITYRNARAPNAMSAVPHERFGRGPVRAMTTTTPTALSPVVGALPVKPVASSLTAGPTTSLRPSREVLSRPAVTLHAPRETRQAWQRAEAKGAETSKTVEAPELRLVPQPKPRQSPPAPFGRQDGLERPAPSLPPRFEDARRHGAAPAPAPETREQALPRRPEPAAAESARESPPPKRAEPPRASPRPEAGAPALVPPRERRKDESGGRPADVAQKAHGQEQARALPGNPTNRLAPKRHEKEDGPKNRPPG